MREKGKNSTLFPVFTVQMSGHCFIRKGIFVEERFGAQIKGFFKSPVQWLLGNQVAML